MTLRRDHALLYMAVPLASVLVGSPESPPSVSEGFLPVADPPTLAEGVLIALVTAAVADVLLVVASIGDRGLVRDARRRRRGTYSSPQYRFHRTRPHSLSLPAKHAASSADRRHHEAFLRT